MDLQEIQDKLNTLLDGEGRKIVFWYDDDGAYTEEIDQLQLSGNSKIIKLTGKNNFATNGIRVGAIIFGAMCIIGLFLPFIQINILGSSLSMSFRDAGSKDFAIFFIAGAVGLAAGAIEQYAFSGIAGIVYGYFFYLDTKDLSELIGYTNDYLAKGLGYYCMIAGALGLLIMGIVGFGIKLNRKK